MSQGPLKWTQTNLGQLGGGGPFQGPLTHLEASGGLGSQQLCIGFMARPLRIWAIFWPSLTPLPTRSFLMVPLKSVLALFLPFRTSFFKRHFSESIDSKSYNDPILPFRILYLHIIIYTDKKHLWNIFWVWLHLPAMCGLLSVPFQHLTKLPSQIPIWSLGAREKNYQKNLVYRFKKVDLKSILGHHFRCPQNGWSGLVLSVLGAQKMAIKQSTP